MMVTAEKRAQLVIILIVKDRGLGQNIEITESLGLGSGVGDIFDTRELLFSREMNLSS